MESGNRICDWFESPALLLSGISDLLSALFTFQTILRYSYRDVVMQMTISGTLFMQRRYYTKVGFTNIAIV